MNTSEVKTTVKDFLFGSFRIQNIDDNSNIFDTGIVHSLFFIRLLVFIEKKFQIELDSTEFEIDKLSTINQIADLIVLKSQKSLPN